MGGGPGRIHSGTLTVLSWELDSCFCVQLNDSHAYIAEQFQTKVFDVSRYDGRFRYALALFAVAFCLAAVETAHQEVIAIRTSGLFAPHSAVTKYFQTLVFGQNGRLVLVLVAFVQLVFLVAVGVELGVWVKVYVTGIANSVPTELQLLLNHHVPWRCVLLMSLTLIIQSSVYYRGLAVLASLDVPETDEAEFTVPYTFPTKTSFRHSRALKVIVCVCFICVNVMAVAVCRRPVTLGLGDDMIELASSLNNEALPPTLIYGNVGRTELQRVRSPYDRKIGPHLLIQSDEISSVPRDAVVAALIQVCDLAVEDVPRDLASRYEGLGPENDAGGSMAELDPETALVVGYQRIMTRDLPLKVEMLNQFTDDEANQRLEQVRRKDHILVVLFEVLLLLCWIVISTAWIKDHKLQQDRVLRTSLFSSLFLKRLCWRDSSEPTVLFLS